MSFAYGFGLPHWQPLSGGFSPAGLFQAGVIGTVYDPSDPTTLFTTSTGTTPCAVPGSGSQVLVGLMLDKSQGAPGALGAELVTSYVSTGAYGNWNALTLSGTTLTSVGGPNNAYSARFNVTAGLTYRCTIPNVLVPSGGTWNFVVSWSSNGSTYSGQVIVLPISTTTFVFVPPATAVSCEVSITRTVASSVGATDTIGPFTAISVKQLPGNHAIAFNDTTARPELSARVNLLTYSEQFENAVWSAIGAKNVTTNTHIAPDGTLTADTLTDNSNVAFQGIGQGVTVPVNNATYVATVYVRKTSGGTSATFGVNLGITGGTSVSVTPRLNTDTGVVISGAGTASDAGDYWLLTCSVANNNTAGNVNLSMAIYPATSSHNVSGDAASATGSAIIWGADLRPTNIGSAIPAYQRIADQYTYDSNGFPRYLRFDGVDDSMYTPASIPFATVTSDGLARRNVFSNPTQFDAAYWTLIAATLSANSTVAPDGTSTAEKLIENTATSNHYVTNISSTFSASTVYTFSAYVKAAERQWVALGFFNESNRTAWFDVANGVVGTRLANVTSSSIEAIGNGWYRCVMTTTSASVQPYAGIATATSNGVTNYTGDGTSGIYIWGAQLETGSTATAFQNIGTDKMSVFAGVRKLSDATTGMLAETSAGASSINGAWLITVPDTVTNRYGFGARGTSFAGVSTTSSTYNAPVSNVLTAIADISAPVTTLRANGTVAATSSATLGTGNFGNHSLFIGTRNNSSFPFNGHLYSLIIAGAQLQSGSITATEQYVAGKTGVQI